MTVDHLDLVVSDLERSLAFYRDLLAPLGYTRESEIVGERGERVVYLGDASGPGSVSLRARQSKGTPTRYDRYAIGLHHLAFAAPSREAVDERHRWLLDTGAEIESPPREYDYAPGYYAVFLHDPDGIKLEIVFEPADIAGLDHVQLAAPPGCETEARRFFGELLGLPELAKPEALREQGGVWFDLRGGQLHIGVEAGFRPARKAHPALRVATGRLTALAARLEQAGVAVKWDEALPGVARFFTEDPWGNRIELLEVSGQISAG
jgi:catechol 2,3-dioxygenase-like lactoylglutathione lyase family enzyme